MVSAMSLFPYSYIPSPDSGRPLSNALIYFGERGIDPINNSIPVFYRDGDNMQVELGQPIITNNGGVPILPNGAPVTLEFQTGTFEYSILVRDKQERQVYQNLNVVISNTPTDNRNFTSVTDAGAVGDGTTDDTIAIQNAINANSHILFPAGTYFTSSDLTVGAGKVLAFQNGATLTSTTAVTVNLDNNAHIEAPRVRIFQGAVTATNAKTVFPEWWGATDSIAAEQNTFFQAALDALKLNGSLLLNNGFYTLNGEVPLSISKGQAVIGKGMYQTTFRLNTTAMNVFRVTNGIGGELSKFRIFGTVDPTEGTAINFNQSDTDNVGRFRITDLWINRIFKGLNFDGTEDQTINTAYIENVYIFDVFGYGARFEECENILSERLFINGGTGEAPQGALVLFNKNQSVDFNECMFINSSASGLSVTNAMNMISRGNDTRWCKFIGCLFDDNNVGVDLNNCSDIRFTNTWASSNGRISTGKGGGAGVVLRGNVEAISFMGGSISNNGQQGFMAENGGFVLDGVTLAGNSVNDLDDETSFFAVDVFAGSRDFTIESNRVVGGGNAFGFTDGNSKGIQVRGGVLPRATENYIITLNKVSGVSGSGNDIVDSPEGTNKFVGNNITW